MCVVAWGKSLRQLSDSVPWWAKTCSHRDRAGLDEVCLESSERSGCMRPSWYNAHGKRHPLSISATIVQVLCGSKAVRWYVHPLSSYVLCPGFTDSESVSFQVRIHLREVRAWRYGKVPREIDCKHHGDETKRGWRLAACEQQLQNACISSSEVDIFAAFPACAHNQEFIQTPSSNV